MKHQIARLIAAYTAAITTTALMSTCAFAADVVIGVPNWPSAQATANVLKVVFEDKLGLKVEMQNGTNPVIFAAMASGAMDVHPEVWLPNQQNLQDKYVKQDGVVRMNANGIPAEQGICVTKDSAQRTGIVNLTDLANPQMAAKFDTSGSGKGKGEMWIGVPGWASTNIEKIRAKSYGYAETMNLKELDEALALAEVDNAVTKKANMVFFCYTPHHMFAMHELVKLKEPPHDAAKWHVMQPTDDPDWLKKSTATGAWDTAYLHIDYSTRLEKAQPAAAAMLSKVKLSTDIVSQMTFALVVEKQDPADFAKKWVAKNAALVDTWLK